MRSFHLVMRCELFVACERVSCFRSELGLKFGWLELFLAHAETLKYLTATNSQSSVPSTTNLRRAPPIAIARDLLEDHRHHVKDHGRRCA